MKAYLVIEMPTACCDCRFCDADACVAVKPYKELTDTLSKVDWCPLKPMPERKDSDGTIFVENHIFGAGWNDCLEEITGETE